MIANCAEISVESDPLIEVETVASSRRDQERRATARAGTDWRDACGDDGLPSLTKLGIGDMTGDWHDRFLIRRDRHMPHAVFIACGKTLQSDWAMERLGTTLEDVLPEDLRDRFAEGCQKSLEESCSVPLEGSYHDENLREILFRCVMMPVQSLSGEMDFIFGAYSHKVAA